MNKQFVRPVMVSDAPAHLQMQWSAYINSGERELVTFEIWNDWRQHGTGRVVDWQPGKGSVPATATKRNNS